MGVTVTRAVREGQTVVTLEGIADSALLARLVADFAPSRACEVVVLDLSHVALARPDVIPHLVAHITASGSAAEVRVVCPRLSARKLLRRFAEGTLAFYPSVTAALKPTRA